MPEYLTTNGIFNLRHLKENYLTDEKNFYSTFRDFEKVFHRVSKDVKWWPLRKLGIDKKLDTIVQSMDRNA